jgi:hypothetical protein
MIVLLDAGPLGLARNPRPSNEARACSIWLEDLLSDGRLVVIPEIADFEVRRELLRIGRMRSIRKLDQLKRSLIYAPITTPIMLRAAEFWAEARIQGQPTAPDLSLDADVILAAQSVTLEEDTDLPAIVATTNPTHIARFVDARHWLEIT